MTTTTSNSGSVNFSISDKVVNKSVYLSGYDKKYVEHWREVSYGELFENALDPYRPRSVEEDEVND